MYLLLTLKIVYKQEKPTYLITFDFQKPQIKIIIQNKRMKL